MAPSRIEELRRRVQADPASIAFAQLAEEYRRSGQTDEAVRVCQEGLTRHPGYLSARVTLGRALLDLSELDAARAEFEFVVAEAPENLAAVRGLAEISQRDGQLADALNYYRRALALARHDPEIEEIVQQLSRQVGVAATGSPGGLSFEEAHQELLSAAERVPVVAPRPAPAPLPASDAPTAPFDFERLVAALGSPAAPPQLEAAVAGQPTAVPVLELVDTIALGPNPFAALEAELRAHEAGGSAAPDRSDTGRYEASAAKASPEAPALPASADAVLEDTMLAESTDAAWVPPALDAGGDDGSAEEEPTAMMAVPGGPADQPPVVVSADDDGGDLADTVALEMAAAGLAAPASEAGTSETVASVTFAAPIAPEPGEGVEFAHLAVTEISQAEAGTAEVEPATAAAEGDAEVAPAAMDTAAAPTAASGDVLGDLESWLDTLHDRSAS